MVFHADFLHTIIVFPRHWLLNSIVPCLVGEMVASSWLSSKFGANNLFFLSDWGCCWQYNFSFFFLKLMENSITIAHDKVVGGVCQMLHLFACTQMWRHLQVKQILTLGHKTISCVEVLSSTLLSGRAFYFHSFILYKINLNH